LLQLYASAKEFMDATATTMAIGLMVYVQVGKACEFSLTRDLAKAGLQIPVMFMSTDNRDSLQRESAGMDGFTLLTRPVSVYALMEALEQLTPVFSRAGHLT
jgi:FixJ family two-component response regulator